MTYPIPETFFLGEESEEEDEEKDGEEVTEGDATETEKQDGESVPISKPVKVQKKTRADINRQKRAKQILMDENKLRAQKALIKQINKYATCRHLII